MDKMGRVGPSGLGGVVMWPRRVYPRKKRAGLKGLRKITEKEELNRPRGSSSQLPSQLSVTGGESLQENDSPGRETPDEKRTPLSESVTHDFETDSYSSSSELVSDSYDAIKEYEQNGFPEAELQEFLEECCGKEEYHKEPFGFSAVSTI